LYAKDEYKFVENDNRVVKPDQCTECSMVGMCPGVDREYFDLFGGKELKPISRRHREELQAKTPHTP
jgi:hypothetical protein